MVQFSIQPLQEEDIPFLWEMLFHAAHMAEDGALSVEDAKQNVFLAQYVDGWGKAGDLGFVATEIPSQRKLGAVWLRLLTEDKSSVSYYDDKTPELAIAVCPEWIGKGIGTALLVRLIAEAKSHYPAIVLTVRADNSARHLYQRLGFVSIGEIENRVRTKSLKMILTFNSRMSV